MKKFRTKLIHMLGGVTLNEHYKIMNEATLRHQNNAYERVKSYMDLLYGEDPKEWCRVAYEYVCRKVKETAARI